MINRYSDHAANERTFLAWVRTAIATMAFGFLIERFDLFLRLTAPSMAGHLGGRGFANVAGLAFVVMGMAMIVIAALRFFKTARQIDAREVVAGPGARFDLALAALLVLLACSLFLYLLHAGVQASASP